MSELDHTRSCLLCRGFPDNPICHCLIVPSDNQCCHRERRRFGRCIPHTTKESPSARSRQCVFFAHLLFPSDRISGNCLFFTEEFPSMETSLGILICLPRRMKGGEQDHEGYSCIPFCACGIVDHHGFDCICRPAFSAKSHEFTITRCVPNRIAISRTRGSARDRRGRDTVTMQDIPRLSLRGEELPHPSLRL